jgi:hypothetical protein
MPRWWHYLHIGVGLFLLVIVAISFVLFSVHSPWSYVVLGGFVAAGFVDLLAGIGFGVESGSRRLDEQRLAGAGAVLLGIAMIAIWVPDLARETIVPISMVGLFGGLLIVGFGIGALYRPAVFGAATREDPTAK